MAVRGICRSTFFRKPFLQLTQSVTKIKYGGAEVAFSKDVKEFLDDAMDLGISAVPPELEDASDLQNVQLSVLVGWAQIEEIINEWFGQKQIEFIAGVGKDEDVLEAIPRPIKARIEYLHNKRIINNSLYSILNEYRALRNKAAHSTSFEMPLADAIKLKGTFESIRLRLKGFLSEFEDSGAKIYELK